MIDRPTEKAMYTDDFRRLKIQSQSKQSLTLEHLLACIISTLAYMYTVYSTILGSEQSHIESQILIYLSFAMAYY